MKLFILDGGRLWMDETLLIARIHSATVQNKNPTAHWVQAPVVSFLLETNDGYILYDTGNHPHTNTDSTAIYFDYQPEQLMPERLKQLGLTPDDIKYVVQSHLHSDHIGYLSLFKNAEIYISDVEFTQAMRLFGLRRFGGVIKLKDFDAFLNANLNWHLIPPEINEEKICEGVTVINLGPGHSFGMVGMLVELPKSGNFLMCSDAIYREENVGPPLRPPSSQYDSLNYSKTIGFISRYAKEHNAKVLFGHDMKQFASLRKSPDGFYE